MLRKMLADGGAADNIGDGDRNVRHTDGGAFNAHRHRL